MKRTKSGTSDITRRLELFSKVTATQKHYAVAHLHRQYSLTQRKGTNVHLLQVTWSLSKAHQANYPLQNVRDLLCGTRTTSHSCTVITLFFSLCFCCVKVQESLIHSSPPSHSLPPQALHSIY